MFVRAFMPLISTIRSTTSKTRISCCEKEIYIIFIENCQRFSLVPLESFVVRAIVFLPFSAVDGSRPDRNVPEGSTAECGAPLVSPRFISSKGPTAATTFRIVNIDKKMLSGRSCRVLRFNALTASRRALSTTSPTMIRYGFIGLGHMVRLSLP